MTKKEKRQKIFDKYGGRCAYCGCEITMQNFNADHLKPLLRGRGLDTAAAIKWRGTDDIENMMPSCRSCNNRKNALNIEQFRQEISLQIERLKRDSNQFNLALRYGLIEITDSPVEFYFERVESQKNSETLN